MAEYHVGCGNFGIYAGILKKNGEEWKDKSHVTDEAMCAAAQYLLENEKRFMFEYHGKNYSLDVTEVEK